MIFVCSQTAGGDGAQPAHHVAAGVRGEPAVPAAVHAVRRLLRRRGRVRAGRQQPRPHQAGAHMAVRAAGGQLHNNGRVPVQELGELGVPGLGVLLLHHADHHRVRRLRARPARDEQGRRHQAAHMVLFAVPAVRHCAAGHELQPRPGGGHQQRQDRGPAPGHHQGRGRGGVRLRRRRCHAMPGLDYMLWIRLFFFLFFTETIVIFLYTIKQHVHTRARRSNFSGGGGINYIFP